MRHVLSINLHREQSSVLIPGRLDGAVCDQEPPPPWAPVGNADVQHVDLPPFARRVLLFVAQGLTDQEISERLNVSLHTIKRAVRDCLVRLSARNRTQAVLLAVANGLLGNVEAGVAHLARTPAPPR
jgi:DNA-binding NarL/FixJ family response regulator